MKILIIPGHGGQDPGAVAPTGEQEDDLNLEIALELYSILRDRGHQVLLSRDKDVYISPAFQLKMIQKEKPDAVIAIHCNASTKAETHGVETLYRDAFDIELAGAVHESLISVTGMQDRGVHQDLEYLKRKLAVLSDLETPACLVEVGYITNEEDLHEIEQDYKTIATAIADGIKTWDS